MKICSRCIYDEKTPKISFDSEGVCNYCKIFDQLNLLYPTGEDGKKILSGIIEEIREKGKNKKYDCVVGVSGGTDSSYLIYLIKKQFGLRPLAVHYDNTWNNAISTENIRKVLSKLEIDLYTHVVDNGEIDDIFRSFFKASVQELDCSTDIGLASVLYMAAEKYGVKYIIEGHSFRTEGVAPLGWSYMDGKYIESIQKQFGTYQINTYPNMKLTQFLRWIAIRRIKKIRPLWYIEYNKRDAQEFLTKEFGWEYYGGHHLENRISSFNMSYYAPKKFRIDQRKNAYAAAVRSGHMSREEALDLMKKDPHIETGLVEYFKKRLGFTEEQFNQIMNLPPKTFKDYKTYKKTFERLRPFFWVMYKMNLVPHSFYIKYTSKSEI